MIIILYIVTITLFRIFINKKMKTKHILITVILILFLGLLTSAIGEKPTIESPELSEMVFHEERVDVEEWMTEPFTIYEEPLVLEEWMTKPFVINEKLCIIE